MGGTDKGGLDVADKGELSGADIEAGKKTSVEDVASSNNSTDGGGKVTD